MTTQEYKKLMGDMRKELEARLEQQEDIEQKIAQLKQAIVSLAPLAKEPETFGLLGSIFLNLGVTDGIREILRASYPKRLSPVEIKEQLKARGQDLSQHKNVMASIHSTLKRMLENNEIQTGDDGLTYGWRRKHVVPSGKRRRLAAFYGDHKPVTEDI
jgi:hypothetical protein